MAVSSDPATAVKVPAVAAAEPAGGKRWRWWRARPFAPVLAVYTALALVMYWPVQPLSETRLIGCGCMDPALDTWFIAWTPHAIVDHVNPLFTTAIEYPLGMNLATNTVMPLLGLLASPVTLTIGPVAAVNLLLRLAFLVSACSMYFVLRRLEASRPAAFAAGLLYGFSPYMVGQGSFHLNLVFVPLPPLILLSLYELVVLRRASPGRCGIRLGVLCVAQYYISVEVLADTALLAAVALLLLACSHPRAALRLAPRVAAGLAVALLPVAALCGYTIWYQVFGPQHLPLTRGFGNLENINEDLLSAIVPTTHQLVATGRLAALGSSYAGRDLPENGGYLGIGLIAVLVLIVVQRRRQPLVRWCALLAAVAWVLSLGRQLIVDNHLTSIPLPFDLLWHLPLTSSELPARYSLLAVLFAAIVLGLGLDRAPAVAPRAVRSKAAASSVARAVDSRAVDSRAVDSRAVDSRAGAARAGAARAGAARADGSRADGSRADGSVEAARRRRVAPRARGAGRPDTRRRQPVTERFLLLAVIALLPLIPHVGYLQPPTRAPAAFLDSAAARAIPAGSVVLTYPYDAPPWNDAMLWQAELGFPFRLIGGYGVTPNALDVDFPVVLLPPTVYDLFEAAEQGSAPPPFDSGTFAELRAYCSMWQVSTILVVPILGRASLVVRYLNAALGPGKLVDGVRVWDDVATRVRRAATSRQGRSAANVAVRQAERDSSACPSANQISSTLAKPRCAGKRRSDSITPSSRP